MPLVEEFIKSGHKLFRWRSYLPLVLIAVLLASLRYFHYPFGRQGLDSIWECLCLLVSLAGFGLRVLVAGYAPRGTSGRNTKKQRADSLNTSGMYSVVRHPLYTGNFLMGLGVSMFLCLWWLPLIYALSFAVYYERIMFTEEAFLSDSYGMFYLEWAQRTPAFLPNPFLWQQPNLPFSLKTALRREYQSLFALVATMFALETVSDWYLNKAYTFDLFWTCLLAAALVMYIVMFIFHKHSTMLKTKGR